MKGKATKELIISLVLLAVAIGVGVWLRTPKENVAAYVNGEPIYQQDVSNLKTNLNKMGLNLNEKAVLDQIIAQKLMLQEAKRLGIKISDKEFNDYLKSYLTQNRMNESTFKEELRQKNISFGEFKKKTMEQMLVLKLVNQTVSSKISISEGMIKEFYNKSSLNESYQDVHDKIKYILQLQLMQQKINEMIKTLKQHAKIVYPSKNNYEVTGDFLCMENNKPIVELFTAENCKPCKWVSEAFDSVTASFNVSAHHWDLTTGDDLLTKEKEKQIPEIHMRILKKYDKNMAIPVVIVGCQYVQIGTTFKDISKEKKVLNELLNKISS